MCKITTVFSLIISFLLVISVFAHPGKTDANGGHYNRSTGEYHYHHGYPAHSHDNGCPYGYDDETNKNGLLSSSKSVKPNQTFDEWLSEYIQEQKEKTAKKNSSIIFKTIAALILIPLAVVGLYIFYIFHYKNY